MLSWLSDACICTESKSFIVAAASLSITCSLHTHVPCFQDLLPLCPNHCMEERAYMDELYIQVNKKFRKFEV